MVFFYLYFFLQEKVAAESLPLLGFTVKLPDKPEGEEEEANIFQLYHKNTLYYTFKAIDNHTAQRSDPCSLTACFNVLIVWDFFFYLFTCFFREFTFDSKYCN